MSRPVVIVDPSSSGIELAPTFRARGIPAVAVTLETEEWPEYGSRFRPADFARVIPNGPEVEDLVRALDPLAILPGTEEAIPLAERLAARLTPRFANDLGKSAHRAHKALMQAALEEAGIPALKTLHTASASEAETWIRENRMTGTPLIVKPPAASGSEKVFHIPAGGDWKTAFDRVLGEALVSGRRNETVVIQEQALGTEYAVGTVSVDGEHTLTHLMRYHKTSAGERRTVFDHVEFVPHDEAAQDGILAYTRRVLDALGVRFGASHTEIMLTEDGPRLIESSPRMIGGPVVGFARAATGSSQADRLAEIVAEGGLRTKEYGFRRTVVPVFLKSSAAGELANLEVLDEVERLPTLLSRHLWYRNGDRVPRTIDYLTSIGIVALTGDRDAIFADYAKIRALEAKLVIYA